MKILQINAVYGIGSTGKIVRDISDKLIELGHESHVMWAIEFKKKTMLSNPQVCKFIVRKSKMNYIM